MKKTIFAALTALTVLVGGFSFATQAQAAFVPNGHGYTWQDNANG